MYLRAVLKVCKSREPCVSKIGYTLQHPHILINHLVKGQGFLPQASVCGFYEAGLVLSSQLSGFEAKRKRRCMSLTTGQVFCLSLCNIREILWF